MSDQNGAETSNSDVGDDSTADVWRCSECGQLNENRDSCLRCGRDRTGQYHKVAPKRGKLNKLSLGMVLAITLLGAPALTYLFISIYWNILPPGAGIEILVLISTPFCAVLVMILVAIVMISAARWEVKRPFVFGLSAAILAYLILWIVGYIFVATY